MNRPMMFACVLLAQLFSFYVASAQSRVHIIPEPAELTENPGEFVLDNTTALIVTGAEKDDKDLAGTVQWFTDKIAASTGYRLTQQKRGRQKHTPGNSGEPGQEPPANRRLCPGSNAQSDSDTC